MVENQSIKGIKTCEVCFSTNPKKATACKLCKISFVENGPVVKCWNCQIKNSASAFVCAACDAKLEPKIKAENNNIFAAFSIYCDRIIPQVENKYNLQNQITMDDKHDPLKAKLASDTFLDYWKGITEQNTVKQTATAKRPNTPPAKRQECRCCPKVQDFIPEVTCKQINGNVKRDVVLDSLRQFLLQHANLHFVYIHFNGPASVKLSAQNKTIDAGRWGCADNNTIGIEYIMEVIDEQASQQNGQMCVEITADCNGSSGIYYRLVEMLNSEWLEVHSNINQIKVYATCNFDEVSFTTQQHGGNYTHFAYGDRKVKIHQENISESTQAGPNGTEVQLFLRKSGIIKGKQFRSKLNPSSRPSTVDDAPCFICGVVPTQFKHHEEKQCDCLPSEKKNKNKTGDHTPGTTGQTPPVSSHKH